MDRNRFAISSAWGWARRGLLFAPLLFLLLFFFYPLLSILAVGLAPEGRLDLSGFTALFTTEYYRRIFIFTVGQAALSTALTLALALPAAFVVTRYSFPGRRFLLSLSTLAFVLPTVVAATAFSAFLGPQGAVNSTLMSVFRLETPPLQFERTLAIILIVHVFYNYAVALRLISGFWANQSARMEEAARVLGCHGWRLWWEIRLPILRPAILAAAALVYIFTFTSFGVVLILGGPRFATFEVEIFLQATSLFNLPVAAALSLAQIGLMFALLLIYTRLQRQPHVELQPAVSQRPNGLRQWSMVALNVGVMIALLFAPLLSLVIRSFQVEGRFNLHNYLALATNPRNSVLFVTPLQAVGNSLLFAMLTTVLALALGLMASYLLNRRDSRIFSLIDPLFMLPLATSAVTLGFGFIIALDEPPLNLRTSPVLIPVAHTLVALPFVVRSVLPALRAIAPNLQESARVLGAPPRVVWQRIDLPLISRGLLVGATFAFTVSMGEFGASLFVARPDMPTMPIIIYRLLGEPGLDSYGRALAMSVLLMFVCALSFALIERLRTSGMGEF